MKSSMTQATHRRMIIRYARFHMPDGSQVWPLIINYRHMRKLLILSLFLILSFRAFAQVKFVARFEVDAELYGPVFEMVRTDNSLVSFRVIPEKAISFKKNFQYFITDSNLNTDGLVEFPVREGFDIVGFDTEGNQLYVLFQKGNYEKAEKYILNIDLSSKNGFEFDANNLLSIELVEFLVVDGKAVFMGTSDSRPVMQIFDMKNKSIHTVQGIFAEDTQILQIRKMAEIDAIDVVLSRKGQFRNRELLVNTYDMSGNLIKEVKVDQFGDPGQEILDALLLPEREDYQQMMIGSFGLERRGAYQGMYLMEINEFGEHQFKLYTLEDFPNFYNYLDEKSKQKKDAETLKEIEKEKIPGIKNVYSIRDVRETEEAYYVYFDQVNIIDSKGGSNSGLYSPTSAYRYDRLSRMGYNPSFNDPFYSNRYPIASTYQVIPEYQYVSAHFIKVGKEGQVIWDNASTYDDLTTTYPNAFGEIAVVGEDLYHIYVENQTIRMSYFKNGERVFERLDFELALTDENERIRETNPESLKIAHWYDRYFLLSGTQKIRFLNESGREEVKEVFFITKVLVDGDLYQPKDLQD